MCTNLLISVPSNPGQQAAPVPMYVSARALELPGALPPSVYVMASGQSWPLPVPPPHHAPPEVQGWTTLTWTNPYGFVGIAGSGSWESVPTFNDGINSAGLSIGGLWFAPGTEFPPPSTATPAPTNQLSYFDFPSWVLGSFATVGEFLTGFAEIAVVGPPETSQLYVPLHYIITDNTGQSVVVEFIGGRAVHYRSDRGVLTNWPSYDWHATNVQNYYHLTPFGSTTSTAGAGNPGGGGFLGLPGEPLSASRFVKAWVLSESMGKLPADGAGWLPAPGSFSPASPGFAGPEQTAVTVALQLVQLCMGTPYGMLLQRKEIPPVAPATLPTVATTYGDYTMWTTVRDHTNVKYYFNSAYSGPLTRIDLTEIDFATTPPSPASPSLAAMPPAGVPWCVDATSRVAQAGS